MSKETTQALIGAVATILAALVAALITVGLSHITPEFPLPKIPGSPSDRGTPAPIPSASPTIIPTPVPPVPSPSPEISPTPISSVTPIPPDRPTYVVVVNQQDKLCLQLSNNENANNTPVTQWECDQGTTKQWFFIDQGNGQYQIVEKSSSKCLQLDNNGSKNGTHAVLWQCDQGSMNLWTLKAQSSGSYEIVNVSSNACLQIDNNNTTNGANVVLWECDQGTEKYWMLS